ALAAVSVTAGVAILGAGGADADRLGAGHADCAARSHESHHGAKKDAASGTALMLKRTMEQAGFTKGIDVSSTRAGYSPGPHTVGFDGPAESIALSHTARDRSTFARGALVAARWVKEIGRAHV